MTYFVTPLIIGLLPVVSAPSGATPEEPPHGKPRTGLQQVSITRDGRPVDADVTVDLWPNQKRLVRLEEGEQVPTLRASIRRVGQGRIDIDTDNVPAGYWEGGSVNYEITVRDQGKMMKWDGVSSPNDGAGNDGTGGVVTLDLGTHSATVNRETVTIPSDPEVGAQNGQVVAGSLVTSLQEIDLTRMGRHPEVAPPDCVWYATNTYVNRVREIWAGGYGWSGAKVRADFDAGSEHKIGIAGPDGQMGERAISTSAGATAIDIVDRYITNYVSFRRYNFRCGLNVVSYKNTPHSFHSLLPNGDFPKAPDLQYKNPQNCAPTKGGFSGWKTQGRNFTIGNGVSVNGVTVSAQSGWSRQTKIGWDVTKPTHLCGDNGGWVVAHQVTARAQY